METLKVNWVVEHKFEFESLTKKEYEQMMKYRPVHDFFPERGNKITDTLESVPGTDLVLTCRHYKRNSRERDCGPKGCPLEQYGINEIRVNCNSCEVKNKRKRSRNRKHWH